ncbi:hypothetical protein F5050DRAFT_1707847 [Lentinula boryana]|uniref:SAP domain-containing protein n=1 Tax=Lentinula boryana TaxID=40481 RepID=A0ABQ8QT64_9AGAR|nr:hypothetical protein F5050DRAFT_1707847 [Lentinula boryana]
MSSSLQTTEILFNSPALHSLKRDQLVKLCKIHSIKASGKNVELIERLKKVAEDLPKGAPLSIATRSDPIEKGDMESDNEADVNGGSNKENYGSRRIGKTAGAKDLPGPSEQWEVMESIAECENEDSGSRNATLRSIASNREFGTGSSKSSTMSSIKALASSLGLKRSTSAKSVSATSSISTEATSNPSQVISSSERGVAVPSMPIEHTHNAYATGSRPNCDATDELSKYAVPYARLPDPSPTQIPQTDHFSEFSHFSAKPPTPATLSKFDFHNREDTAPLPGHVLRPGAPAPDNARLSLGDARFSLGFGLASPRKSASGVTTTIRLVSSSSMTAPTDSPMASTSIFDDENSSTPQLKPWNTAFDLVLGSPSGHGQGDNVRIYPDLPMEDVTASSTTTGLTIPGGPFPSRTAATSLPSPSGVKYEPFVFGSPLPQHRVSNVQFQTAAASVLEEMNRRLLADGVETVGTSLISNLELGTRSNLNPDSRKKYTDREIKPLRKSFGAHAAKKEVKEKFDKAHEEQFDGMESIAGYLNRKNNHNHSTSTAGAGPSNEPVQIGKKRKSSAIDDVRPAPVKRPSTRVISNTRRTVPGGFGDEEEEEPVGKKARVEFSGQEDIEGKEAEKPVLEKSEKEREAIRRKLEMNRARRRSSAANGRASMGRARVSMGRNGKPQPKPVASKSRFGFLSSAAKSIVKGVWGGGKKTSTTVASKSPAVAPANATSAPNPVARTRVAPSGTQRKASTTDTSSSKPISTSSSSRSRDLGTMNSLGSVAATIHSSRSRSPIPSFAAPTKSSSVRTSTTGTASISSTRNNSIANSSRVSRISAASATSSRVSSLGTRGSLNPISTSSTSSRLLAPTASSLAKTASINRLKSGNLNVPSEKPTVSSPSSSGAPAKIFSKALVVPLGSGLPSPVRSGSSQTVARGVAIKQRSLSGRKPRISRSKVIAKLASQRAASGSGPPASTNYTGPSALGLAAKRSSLGVGVHKAPRKSIGGARRSHVGVSGTRNSEASILLSARKRARQSEYARRRSRATGGASNVGTTASACSEAMIVDP